MPYFDCKIVVVQGKIGFIKVILIEKIDDFSPPQARNFEKTKVIKGILLLKITYFSSPQAENFTISVCKKSEKFCKN